MPVCNNHSPAPIYGWYLPRTGVFFLWLLRTWFCQYLLHLSYVCVYCGAWSAPGAVSACGTCRMCWLYVCIVVLRARLVLSLLHLAYVLCFVVLGAHLVLSACCSCRMCWLYVCVVVLGEHLVLSVLAAHGIYVCYVWCFERTYVLAICIVGCLAHTWCEMGVALVKFQTFPISYGVTGHICIL